MPKTQKLQQETVQTDVLVVGAGLAGCMAAIRASELVGSKNILVLEKSHVKRSGNAASGIDHTWSYMPEVHEPMGYTVEQLVEEHIHSMGSLQDHDLVFTVTSTIAHRIKEMERWGFPFKTRGEYDYVKKVHNAPTFLHWAGRDQKLLFAKELDRRGIRVINRVMITELIKEDGKIVGAIGIGIREPKFYVFGAKSVVLATAGITRLFPGPTSLDFNRSGYIYGSGDGVAMAYRAGAEVTNIEFFRHHSGPKNFCRSGRGTYVGIVEDARGEPVGEVRAVADAKKIDISVESPGSILQAYREGRGPVYMNCTGSSEDDKAYMEWGLMNEGNIVTLQHMKEEGMDLRKDRVEFTFYEPRCTGGLAISPSGETNIKGLFAAGDVVGNIKRGVSPAAFAIGWLAGESAAEYIEGQENHDMVTASTFIEAKRDFYNDMLERETGATWQEASLACQNVMSYYAGETCYETLLQAGLRHLRKIAQRAFETVTARNLHELMRCLEAINSIQLGEAAILCMLERKESRTSRWGTFVRIDYPEVNEEMNKLLLLKLENGSPVFNWREPRRRQ